MADVNSVRLENITLCNTTLSVLETLKEKVTNQLKNDYIN